MTKTITKKGIVYFYQKKNINMYIYKTIVKRTCVFSKTRYTKIWIKLVKFTITCITSAHNILKRRFFTYFIKRIVNFMTVNTIHKKSHL